MFDSTHDGFVLHSGEKIMACCIFMDRSFIHLSYFRTCYSGLSDLAMREMLVSCVMIMQNAKGGEIRT